MSFQPDPQKIQWRLHLRSSITEVYRVLSTDRGRAGFWAESAVEQNGIIHFVFPNGFKWHGRILTAEPPTDFSVEYIGNSIVTFQLNDDGPSGTDLVLTDTGVPEEYRAEVIAGWVSVLMALKAAVDFNVDLRNHDPARNWDQGYVEN